MRRQLVLKDSRTRHPRSLGVWGARRRRQHQVVPRNWRWAGTRGAKVGRRVRVSHLGVTSTAVRAPPEGRHGRRQGFARVSETGGWGTWIPNSATPRAANRPLACRNGRCVSQPGVPFKGRAVADAPDFACRSCTPDSCKPATPVRGAPQHVNREPGPPGFKSCQVRAGRAVTIISPEWDEPLATRLC